MSPVDFTYILDEDLPPVDRSQVRPSVDAVALLEATRLVDISGADQTTFTDTTRPTAAQCQGVIDQAVELALADIPDYLPESSYPRIQQLVALKAACLIERSFFREQYNKGSAEGYEKDYDLLVEAIERVVGGSGFGERVDSVMMRSTMAEYEPDYPVPPPRIMPRMPFPFDGNPDSEGQADN
jgi:hypothetical protein